SPVTIATVMLSSGFDFYGDVPGTAERLSDIPVIDIDSSAGAHAGTLYVAMYTFTGGLTHVQVSTSTTGGATWSPAVAVFPAQTVSMFFPWLSVNRANGLVGMSYDYGNNAVYRASAAFSANGGTSFAG